MKKLLFFLLLPGLVVLNACGNSENATDVNNSQPLVPAGMVELDLFHPGEIYSLNLLINVPDEETGKGLPQITEGPMGGTQIVVGKDFSIEIRPGDGNIAEKKKELANDGVFKSTYLLDEPDAIIYKSEIEGTEIVQYHFYAVITVGNGSYEVENTKDEDFSEKGIRMMLEAARSLRTKPQA